MPEFRNCVSAGRGGRGERRRVCARLDGGVKPKGLVDDGDVVVHGLGLLVGGCCCWRLANRCWFLSGSVSGSCLGDDAIVFVMPVPRLALDMVFRSPCAADAQMLGKPLSPSPNSSPNSVTSIKHGLEIPASVENARYERPLI